MSKSHLARLRLMVERVSNIVFGSNGVATSEGLDGSELESAVGMHFGFYSRPKDGARGWVLKADGQGNTSLLVCWRDKQYELTLQKGEVGVQNAFGASTLWDKNGNIIETPSGSGTVQLAGSTYSLLKTEDFLNALKAALSTILASNTGGNILSDGGTAITTLTSAITAGTYKSTKAKNG